jgi:hypothetical protein
MCVVQGPPVFRPMEATSLSMEVDQPEPPAGSTTPAMSRANLAIINVDTPPDLTPKSKQVVRVMKQIGTQTIAGVRMEMCKAELMFHQGLQRLGQGQAMLNANMVGITANVSGMLAAAALPHVNRNTNGPDTSGNYIGAIARISKAQELKNHKRAILKRPASEKPPSKPRAKRPRANEPVNPVGKDPTRVVELSFKTFNTALNIITPKPMVSPYLADALDRFVVPGLCRNGELEPQVEVSLTVKKDKRLKGA